MKKGTKEVPDGKQFKKKKEIMAGVAGAVTALYPIINLAHNALYQNDCEGFYNIPRKYFHSRIDEGLLYLSFILIIIALCALPIVIKKNEEKDAIKLKGTTVYVIFLAAFIGGMIGLINVLNLMEIIRQASRACTVFDKLALFLDNHVKGVVIVTVVIVVLGSAALVGLTLIDKIKDLKHKWAQKIVEGLVLFALLISISLMVSGTILKLSVTVKDKTRYEFVSINDKDYVVLSEHEDKLLVVQYEIKENEQYIFHTDQYYFWDEFSGTHQYITLKNNPIIVK